MKKEMLGGNRIGSGNKMTYDAKTFNRSTHNLSEVFRSTMSAGTLVPTLVLPTLPGDTIDIDLDADVRTLPTVGPLFGSYKFQLDVYQIPIRPYIRDLQMNKLEIGRDMSKVLFPQVQLQGNDIITGLNYEYTKETPWGGKEIGNCQIEASSIMSYLGIKGIGQNNLRYTAVDRFFNGLPWIMYWEIVKQYYANKMEDNAYYIHNDLTSQNGLVRDTKVITNNEETVVIMGTPHAALTLGSQLIVVVAFPSVKEMEQWLENELKITFTYGTTVIKEIVWEELDLLVQKNVSQMKIYYTARLPHPDGVGVEGTILVENKVVFDYNRPNLKKFPLKNIDTLRERLMGQEGETPYVLSYTTPEPLLPYSSLFERIVSEDPTIYKITSLQCKQEGLAVKTYQSDVNNNWLNTEWIDGENGVNAITAIQVDEDGKFTLDEFNIKKKVYDMLNHIVASGGSYDDWQDTIWGVQRMRQISSPVYEGGLSKELVFQEVISNSASNASGEQPLGTLAGRGVLNGKHKGGKIVIKTTEPSYIIAIASLTPRIDYSTGNEWHTNLMNMGELHNPYLDGIGYQDMITDTVAFWDTKMFGSNPTFKSAGKQPAWINYQTSKNKVYGNFALENEQMFMVLNRRYEIGRDGDGYVYAGDITTYIDPQKYNHIFADTSEDAMNFWVQIDHQITARRVMSGNQIPNL